MSHEYLTIFRNRDPRTVFISDIDAGVPQSWDLDNGVSLKGRITEATTLSMDPEQGDLLLDFIPNSDQALIASERARALLESEGLQGEQVEYLPFTLVDKRGKPTRQRFFFINLLRKIDCMDAEASEFTPAAGGGILDIDKLHLRQERIPEDARLFRLGEFPRLHVIRADLLQRIQDVGLTGLEVLALGERIY
jgi:hypothetical protein